MDSSYMLQKPPLQCTIYKIFNHYAKDYLEKKVRYEEKRTQERLDNAN